MVGLGAGAREVRKRHSTGDCLQEKETPLARLLYEEVVGRCYLGTPDCRAVTAPGPAMLPRNPGANHPALRSTDDGFTAAIAVNKRELSLVGKSCVGIG